MNNGIEELEKEFQKNVKSSGVPNHVQKYMESIGAFPLLTRKQEIELGNRIKTGDKEAEELLFNSNLRLVVSIAKNYKPNQSQSFMDYIQEGNIGLLKAVKKFNPDEGNRFSTMATWWIRQAISQSINDNSRTIRIPTHALNELSAINKQKEELTKSNGVAPTLKELSEKVGKDEEELDNLLRIYKTPLSLDYTTNNNEDVNIMELICDHNATNPQELANYASDRETLLNVLDTLDDVEKEIIIQRFGLDDGEPKSLDLIGKNLGYSRERIRQLDIKALRKLRNPIRKKALEGLF